MERNHRTRTTIEILFTFADGSKRRWRPNKHGHAIELPGVRAERVDRVRPSGKVKVKR